MATIVKCVSINTEGYNYIDASDTIIEKSSTHIIESSDTSNIFSNNIMNIGPFPWKGEYKRDKDNIIISFSDN